MLFRSQASMDPTQSSFETVIAQGSTTAPSMAGDSTFDTGHYGYSANGTHFKLKAQSAVAATQAARGAGGLRRHFAIANHCR